MYYHFKLFILFAVFFLVKNFAIAQTERLFNPEVSNPVTMSVSRPLSDLPIATEDAEVKWKDGIVPLMKPF